MTYRWVDHTAELELEVEAPTAEEIFAETLRACAELLDEGPRGVKQVRRVELGARDPAALLVAWLDELVYLAETEALVPVALVEIELAEQRLGASVAFTRAAPRHVIKGATYHRLLFASGQSGYRARVVLDV